MSVAPVQCTSNSSNQFSAAELIGIEAQILAGAKAMIAGVSQRAQGMGGALARPALLRRLDQLDPGYRL
ncbi:hypothetical protein SAMN04487857_10186 [Pseudomonas sp. ok272]|nr:hypothetical protein SAMN04487857_10186 [Pseudomonas sp. ok272]SFM31322.1 hypothetical protein SAMN04487858_10286 [Pseudomonas sp. ok602]